MQVDTKNQEKVNNNGNFEKEVNEVEVLDYGESIRTARFR